jgi:hypothetical protein
MVGTKFRRETIRMRSLIELWRSEPDAEGIHRAGFAVFTGKSREQGRVQPTAGEDANRYVRCELFLDGVRKQRFEING